MTSYIPKILEIFGKRHIYPLRFIRVSLINRFKISKIFQKRHIYPSSYILIDPCSLNIMKNPLSARLRWRRRALVPLRVKTGHSAGRGSHNNTEDVTRWGSIGRVLFQIHEKKGAAPMEHPRSTLRSRKRAKSSPMVFLWKTYAAVARPTPPIRRDTAVCWWVPNILDQALSWVPPSPASREIRVRNPGPKKIGKKCFFMKNIFFSKMNY